MSYSHLIWHFGGPKFGPPKIGPPKWQIRSLFQGTKKGPPKCNITSIYDISGDQNFLDFCILLFSKSFGPRWPSKVMFYIHVTCTIRSEIAEAKLRRRSTVSMVTSFVLGITFSHEILVKLRRPFGTALRASASISLKFHSKMLPKKKPVTRVNPSYSGRSPPSSFSIPNQVPNPNPFKHMALIKKIIIHN